MNTQTVLVEFHNTEPFFYTIKSKNPITIDSVARYFEITEGFNPDRDSITFLDESTTIDIDEVLDEQHRRDAKNGLYGGESDDAN